MKAFGLVLLGFVLGALTGYYGLFGTRHIGVAAENRTLQLKTDRDTVIINAQKDTVIIYAQKDTVIIYSQYCDQKPRPPDCPPKTTGRLQVR